MTPAMTNLTWQHLEDIACAYWQSEALFSALRLELFAHLTSPTSIDDLASQTHCRPEALARLLPTLKLLGLIERNSEEWQNTTLATNFLDPKANETYLGNFLLYRQYLQPAWQGLAEKISSSPLKAPLSREQTYEERNFHYVQALDALSKIKAQEICAIFNNIEWIPPILDIGGGSGSLSRALLKTKLGEACLFELPEVIAAAQKIYPEPEHWQNIKSNTGDFRTHSFATEERFGLVILGNFLHTYAPDAARQLLRKALSLAKPNGRILIHDYFPDQPHDQLKGQLYDLNMMLNTYDGHCHQGITIQEWLHEEGWQSQVYSLPSDSAVIIAYK